MSLQTLHSYRREACTLNEALAALPGLVLQGFAYAPARFVFLRWNGRTLDTGRADDDQDQFYEARLFEPEAVELRWLRDPDAARGVGTAVLLSETARACEGWRALPALDYEQRIDDAAYLGTPVAAEPASREGWWRFDAPRHGKLELPLGNAQPGRRLRLLRREYVGPATGAAGQDGNREIVETRLLAWDTFAEESAR